LQDAFFLVGDDGAVDWGLLYPEEVIGRQEELDGADLFSFPDSNPARVTVEPNEIDWGSRFTTTRSAAEFTRDIGQGQLADKARSIETSSPVFNSSVDTTLGFYSFSAESANTDLEKHSLTGRIEGLFPSNDNFNLNDSVSVPAIDYTGGRYADPQRDDSAPIPRAQSAHLQLFDGFTHNLPAAATSDYQEELGVYSGRFSELYTPAPPSGTNNRLVPSFAHSLNPALPILNSMALNRARVFAKINELILGNAGNFRREVLGDTVKAIVEGASRAGAPQPPSNATETVVMASRLLLPAATGAIGFIFGGPAGAAAGFFIGEAIDTALTAFTTITTEVRSISDFSVLEGVEQAQTNIALAPLLKDTTDQPVPLDFSALASLQGDAGTQRLAVGADESHYRAYDAVLQRQQTVLDNYAADYDTERRNTVAGSELAPFVDVFDQYLDAQKQSVRRERRILRQLILSRMLVRFDAVPSAPEVGESVLFTVTGTDPPAGEFNDQYRWSVDPLSSGEASAGGGTPDTQTADSSLRYTFDSPGRYRVRASPKVQNVPGTSGTGTGSDTRAKTEVEVVSGVSAAIDVPNYDETVPVGEAVEFDASGSASLADGESIAQYEWYVQSEIDAFDDRREIQYADGDGGIGDLRSEAGPTTLLEFDSANTYTVTLLVEDTRGRTATESVEITAFSDDSGVVAQIELPGEPVPVGEPVTFDGSSSLTPFDGDIDSYEWELTDKQGARTVTLATGTGPTFTTTFDERPSFEEATIELRVEDNVDAPDTFFDGVSRTIDVASDELEFDIQFDTEETREATVDQSVTMSVPTISGEVIQSTEWQTRHEDDSTPVHGKEPTRVRGRRYTETFSKAGKWTIRVVVNTDSGEYSETEFFWVVGVDFDDTRSLDGDELNEDINGNYLFDFDDVTTFEEHLGSSEFQDNAEAFDFDGNGDGPDQGDVEALFEEIAEVTDK